MPLYEYECSSCKIRFERIQKFSDPSVEACPTCGAKVRKVLSSPAIQFKGTGWYVTDYGNKPGRDKPADDTQGSEGGKDAKSVDSSSSSSDTTTPSSSVKKESSSSPSNSSKPSK